ncbi:MAG: hypothetical protein CMJ77_14605 [Planctomycetaceae bacterium]|nr:hypothetical protein [Planctomycetaceae bacterium]
MKLHNTIIFSLAILTGLSAVVHADDHEEAPVKVAGSEFIPGVWLRESITPEGKVSAMTKKIVPMDAPNHFVETITSTFDGRPVHEWQLRFSVKPVVGRVLQFVGSESRSMNMETSTWNDWTENNLTYVFQPDEFFWNEIMGDLDHGNKRKFRRIGGEKDQQKYEDLARRKLKPLQAMLGIWQGTVEQPANPAYGFPAHTQKITHPVQLADDETMIVWNWKSDLLEGYGATSYSAYTGEVVTNYHTSTGVQMTGRLISSSNNKFLWEREGHTPTGVLQEKCLIDLSKPGVFRHVIMDRTLNGVPQPQEPEIILKKVQ